MSDTEEKKSMPIPIVQRKRGRRRIYNTEEEKKRARVFQSRKHQINNPTRVQKYIHNEMRRKRVRTMLKKIDFTRDNSEFIEALKNKFITMDDEQKRQAREIIEEILTATHKTDNTNI